MRLKPKTRNQTSKTRLRLSQVVMVVVVANKVQRADVAVVAAGVVVVVAVDVMVAVMARAMAHRAADKSHRPSLAHRLILKCKANRPSPAANSALVRRRQLNPMKAANKAAMEAVAAAVDAAVDGTVIAKVANNKIKP